jgi:hypothetical protein
MKNRRTNKENAKERIIRNNSNSLLGLVAKGLKRLFLLFVDSFPHQADIIPVSWAKRLLI